MAIDLSLAVLGGFMALCGIVPVYLALAGDGRRAA